MASRRLPLDGARIGSLIGAVGGLLFVELNAWPLGDAVSVVVRFFAALWFVWVVVDIVRIPEDPSAVRPDARQMQAFWIVVLIEVVLLFSGTQLFIRVLDAPEASLPWVATVLGVHWLIFRMVFREDVFLWLGWLSLTLGVVGLVVVLTGVAGEDTLGATAIASGLVVGLVMLVCVQVDAHRRRRALVSPRASRPPRGRSTSA